MKEYKIKLSEAPALIVHRNSIEKAAEKGTILFYHGLKACKETNMKEYLSLADRGFLSVGIDNVGHGERTYSDFEERLKRENYFEETFLSMVQQTSEEIPSVIDELVKKGLTDPEKIGICGISMGGYITYGSVLFEKRIKAIAPVLGSPKWKSSINSSPKNHPEKFYPVALLAQNAGQDSCVPPQFARDFHEVLIPYYKESPEKIAYIEYPQSNHFMIEEEWNELWENLLNWFEKFIN
jgi:hypothetical protein